MEEKYKKFLEIDWANNKDWQLYFSNLTPTPPGNKVLYYKKRFYRLKIDNEFDITWEPQQTNSTNNQNQRSNNFTGFQTNFVSLYGDSLFAKVQVFIEFWLWIISTGLIIIYHSYGIKVSLIPLFMRIFRRVGRPRFNMEYVQTLMLDEHFHIFLYMLLLLIDRTNIFTTFPFMITMLLNTSDYLRHTGVLLKLANKLVNIRTLLSELRASSEIIIGFLMIVGIFFKLNSFLLPIFYWQFLRFKYIFNTDNKLAFTRLNNSVNKFKLYLPKPLSYVIEKIQQIFEYLGKTESKDGSPAGGANCNIF